MGEISLLSAFLGKTKTSANIAHPQKCVVLITQILRYFDHPNINGFHDKFIEKVVSHS